MRTTFLSHLSSLKVLFFSLMTLWFVVPFLQHFEYAQFIFTIGFSFVLLATIYSVLEVDKSNHISLYLGVVSVGVNFIATAFFSPQIEIVSMTLNLLFISYVLYLLFHMIFTRGSVNVNVVLGAICIYLLLAVNFGILYTLVDALVPNSFTGLVAHSTTGLDTFFKNFLYYSLVTMTTLGYGDIMPMSQPARYFAAFQSALGQIYMGILVARLLGIHLMRRL